MLVHKMCNLVAENKQVKMKAVGSINHLFRHLIRYYDASVVSAASDAWIIYGFNTDLQQRPSERDKKFSEISGRGTGQFFSGQHFTGHFSYRFS